MTVTPDLRLLLIVGVLWLIAIAALLAGTAQAAAQGQAVGVFTTQQAAAGKSAYEKSCAVCHMRDMSGDTEVPALAGAQFMSTWRTRSTKDLMDYMSRAMPPGSSPLGAETYASITAYILQANGAVAGAGTLTASTAAPIGGVTGRGN